jgi:hypothetical protein
MFGFLAIGQALNESATYGLIAAKGQCVRLASVFNERGISTIVSRCYALKK